MSNRKKGNTFEDRQRASYAQLAGARKIGQSEEAKQGKFLTSVMANAETGRSHPNQAQTVEVTSLKIKRIITFLQENPNGVFTQADIEKRLNFKLDAELLGQLRGREKISLVEKNDDVEIRFKPTFDIENIDALRTFFRERKFKGVVDQDLLDAYTNVANDLKLLEENQEIVQFARPKKENAKTAKIYLYNDKQYEPNLPEKDHEQLKLDWRGTCKSTDWPTESDLQRIMIQKNLRPMQRIPAALQAAQENKRKQRKTMKRTNVHMEP